MDNFMDKLRLPFATSQIKKNDRGFDYVPPEHVIDRLNDVLGGRWAFSIVDVMIVDDEVICQGILTIDNIPRSGIGTDRILRQTNAGKKIPGAVGKAYKSAASNCLKLCGRLWGLGNHLWGGELMPETSDNEPDEPEESAPAPWIETDEGIEAVEEAAALFNELAGITGPDIAKKTVKSILDNVSPFEHTYRKFNDPAMQADHLLMAMDRIRDVIADERDRHTRSSDEIHEQSAAVAAQPD